MTTAGKMTHPAAAEASLLQGGMTGYRPDSASVLYFNRMNFWFYVLLPQNISIVCRQPLDMAYFATLEIAKYMFTWYILSLSTHFLLEPTKYIGVEKRLVSTFYWLVHVEVLERVTHTK